MHKAIYFGMSERSQEISVVLIWTVQMKAEITKSLITQS
jgi:hypothetical protein